MASSRYHTHPEDCTREQLESVSRLYDFIYRIKPVLAQRREERRATESVPEDRL